MTPTKILVVDDEPDLELLIRQKFRRHIKDERLAFVFAHNGREALRQLAQNPDVDVVLSDINMPEMDGLTLLAELQAGPSQLKAVMVSAYGDLQNIRTAMNRGAFDFVTKPIDFADLELTINKCIGEMIKIRDGLVTRQELLAIRGELEVARHIQQSIVPKDFGPKGPGGGFSVFAEMIPATEVGGDFYDFFMIDDEHLALVLGDVAGKGVGAAIYMSISRTLVRAAAQKGIAAGDCLRIANRTLCAQSDTDLFVTVCYAIVNTRTGAVQYSTGGHYSPSIVRATGRVEVPPSTGGMALGIDEDVQYGSGELQLEPGDLMTLYSDGITEAMTKDDELFGDERFKKVLEAAAGGGEKSLVESIVAQVQLFAAGRAHQADDMTLVAVKRT